jgi:thiamine biosynthesis lipoprotein
MIAWLQAQSRPAIRRFIAFFTFVVFGIIFGACARPASPARAEFALGTVCRVNLYELGTQKLYARSFSRLNEIDRTMSARAADSRSGLSSLMEINQNAGIAPVKVPQDLLEVLEQARGYAELTGGAFDPTIGPLVNLWGIGTENERVPSSDEIAEALALIDWRDLIIDREEKTAFLRRRGMALDLGAIAKGYAADEAARLVKEAKAARATIDLGGNVLAIGGRTPDRGVPDRGAPDRDEKREALPWRIGIQDPLAERGSYIGVLLAQDKTVVTSGVYERYFESEGKRYHHIFSTSDGYPVDNGLLSVTIVTNRSIDADALSTAVFTLGYAHGMALLETIPHTEAIFIFEDLSVRRKGLRETFSLANGRYTFR